MADPLTFDAEAIAAALCRRFGWIDGSSIYEIVYLARSFAARVAHARVRATQDGSAPNVVEFAAALFAAFEMLSIERTGDLDTVRAIKAAVAEACSGVSPVRH